MKKLLLLFLFTFSFVNAFSDDFDNEFGDEFGDEFAAEFEESSGEGSSANEEKGFEFSGSVLLEQVASISDQGPLKDADQTWMLANRKFRLKTIKTIDNGGLYVNIDFVRDDVINESSIDFRELRLQYKATSWLDISAGKQVSTWGVGDMLFINDLFPKNWRANFLGQDMEYLKEPATALRLTNYIGRFTFNMVYTPQFSPDITPTGHYVSTYNPNTQTIEMSDNPIEENDAAGAVSNDIEDGELAGSLKSSFGNHELALYVYKGRYKNPRSMHFDGSDFTPLYPHLSAYGLSDEASVGPGIFTLEYAYYYSEDDVDELTMENYLIENSMHKFLVGYKMDLTANLSLGSQAYGEYMTDFNDYESLYKSFNGGSTVGMKEELQMTYTFRLTFKAQQETLWFNLFTYIRPDDRDSFTKFDISKRLDNHFTVIVGANIFTGKDGYEAREFGSLKDNDNVFVRFKYDL